MAKIKSLAELRNMKSELQTKIKLRENANNPESMVQIKVGMATSGIAVVVNESGNEMLGNERRGSWGDLWGGEE